MVKERQNGLYIPHLQRVMRVAKEGQINRNGFCTWLRQTVKRAGMVRVEDNI